MNGPFGEAARCTRYCEGPAVLDKNILRHRDARRRAGVHINADLMSVAYAKAKASAGVPLKMSG
jgi:hypothetical protein